VRRSTPLQAPPARRDPVAVRPATRELIGADVFVESPLLPEQLGSSLERLVDGSSLRLKMISNRGTKVYPDGNPNIDVVDHYRCRFVRVDESSGLDRAAVRDLVGRVEAEHDWCHVELLHHFDGAPSYTKAQGED
jgi:isocitrate dehydrogenase